MVNPIYIIVVTLAAAFILGLLNKQRTMLAYLITLAALAVVAIISAGWLWYLAIEGGPIANVFTAGTAPPFAINLRVGLPEASLLFLVHVVALLSAVHMKDMLVRKGRRAMAVLLIAIMALAGIIMTRDIFNLFVFFELVAISTGGMVLLSDDPRALVAGIKYLVIAQVISILLLIGIGFTYHATGSLNIDFMENTELALTGAGALIFFLLLVPFLIELKPFPANGWALDIYQSAHPAFSAILSAATGSAALFGVDKIMSIGGASWGPVITGVGLLSFVVSNILALVQTDDRRLLGYSSIAQTGLILAVIGQRDLLGENYLFVAGGLLIGHALAKAGLFWLSGLVRGRLLINWADLRRNPFLIFAFASFVAMLVGLPPFPGFYAKWELIHGLMAADQTWLVALILFGALLEAGYLFRWFGYMLKRPVGIDANPMDLRSTLVVIVTSFLGWGAGYIWGELSGYDNLLGQIVLLFALGFLFLEWLPAKIKNTIAIMGLLGWFWHSYADFDPLQMIFGSIILVGGAVILLASYNERGKRVGFYPSAMLMFSGLSMLIVAEQTFQFFAAWELLTLGSYFLILRGKKSEPHALAYILFSLAGAFGIIAGFALAANGQFGFELTSLGDVASDVAPWVFILLAVGFMTKTAVIGLHIWLPGAHAEAETDVSPMVSGILLKAGLFGLMVLLMNMGSPELNGVKLTYVMLWIGALTALTGNLLAAFQEDAKRLLAYSSIGQMGYAIFGLALMNHLGWLMAMMFVINHYVYKSMLFLSIGGVAKRTGTKLMYKMGGLITLLPLSFFVVLIGIIAVSGVPPLSGFGGRWLFYNAILEGENRLPMVIIFLSGPIAFLYLFRLIHTIFLGQLKDEHRKLKEAPFWILVPQVIYVTFLLGFAVVPGLALRRVDSYLDGIFPEGGLNWDGLTIFSNYGYWSPVSIMLVTGGIFAVVFALLFMLNRNAQRVKQFNIVYSAERPFRPETTHFAWNFFAPYRKAIWFLLLPIANRFWEGLSEALHAIAGFMRRFYTGDAQHYIFHMLGFVVGLYLILLGVR